MSFGCCCFRVLLCFSCLLLIFYRFFFWLILLAYTPVGVSSPDLVTRDATQRANPSATHINVYPHGARQAQSEATRTAGRTSSSRSEQEKLFVFIFFLTAGNLGSPIRKGLENWFKRNRSVQAFESPPFMRVGLRDNVYHTNSLG